MPGAVGIGLPHIGAYAGLVRHQPQAGKLHKGRLHTGPQPFFLTADIFGPPAALLHGAVGIVGHIGIQVARFPGLAPAFNGNAYRAAYLIQIVGGQAQLIGLELRGHNTQVAVVALAPP